MAKLVEVFAARDLARAYVIKAALEGSGIEVTIANEYGQAVFGAVPVGSRTTPRILVDESDAARAEELLRELPERPDAVPESRKEGSIVLEEPRIVQTEIQKAAVIRFTIPSSEIQTAMCSGIGEVMGTIGAQGVAPAGPWFSHHLRMKTAGFDFELGVPIAEPIAPTGRVQMGELPARKVARTIYHGGYEGLGAAWGELDAWIRANGHKAAGDLWECYLAGPESSPDPANWRTELNRPLVDEE